MKLTFNPKEALSAIAGTCITAFAVARGIPADEAMAAGSIAEGVVKGFEKKDTPTPILEELENVIRQAIHQAMAEDELVHLTVDFEDMLFEKAFSVPLIEGYLLAENPVKILEGVVRQTLESTGYDPDTLPIESLAIYLIKNIEKGIQNSHELTSLTTYLSVQETKEMLRGMTSVVSQFENTLHDMKFMLEDMVPAASKFEMALREMRPISDYASPDPLHYLNRKIGFHGRADEFQWLDQFRSLPENLLYTVVQGCTGMGKSRLMYEYINSRSKEEDWLFYFLNDHMTESVLSFPSWECSGNLFLVADYAGKYSETIGKWIRRLAESKRPVYKMRIVLLERLGVQADAEMPIPAPWIQNFYGDMHQAERLKEVEYQWLYLLPLDKRELFDIMDDYAAGVLQKGPLTNEDKERIFTYVTTELESKPSRQSTLFVLLAADAFLCRGSIKDWDMCLLAKDYVDRMLEHWNEALCRRDEKLYDSLLRVVVFATASGGVDLGEQELVFLKEDLERIFDVKECRSILQNASGLYNETILPIQPDYIGEFVFLKYLEGLFPGRKRHDFLDALYDCPVDFMNFFIKCMDDFFGSDMFGKLFCELVDLLKPREESAGRYGAYACMLADMAARVPQVKAYRLAALLGVVFESRVVQESVIFGMVEYQYYATLANMTRIENYDDSAYIDFREQKDWSLNNAYEAVKKLRRLYRRFSRRNPRLLLPFALALANCSVYDSSEEAKQCVDELSELYEKYWKSQPKLSIYYAMALNNLLCKLGAEQAVSHTAMAGKAISELRILYKRHVAEAHNYGNVLVYMVNAVSNPALRADVDRQIEKVHAELSMHQMRVVLEYAKGLHNIMVLYMSVSSAKTMEYFATLERIYGQYKSVNKRIVVEYAKSIVIMMESCTDEKASQLLEHMKKLCAQYEKDEEISEILVIRYARAMYMRLRVAVRNGTGCANADCIYTETSRLNDRYHHIYREVGWIYVNCVVYMLCLKKDGGETEKCRFYRDRLKELCNSPEKEISQIACQYADIVLKQMPKE